MQAAVVNVLGQAPSYQTFPDPVAREGKAEVRVRAVGPHPIVKALASGSHYSAAGEVPAVPGLDGVGTLKDGSRVYFAFVRKPWGTMAERAVTPRQMCMPLPDGLGDAEAANGIDVVIDYLWGRPTELLLEALAKGFRAGSTRPTRLVDVGESAGKNITLPGAALRSIDLKPMGSGFGAVPLDRALGAIPTLFSLAAKGALKIAVEPVPLADAKAAWSRVEKGRRIVLMP